MLYETNVKAKSACKWTDTDLAFFRVNVVNMPPEHFFGCEVEDLPMPDLSETPLKDLMKMNLMEKDGAIPNTAYLADFLHMIRAVSESATELTLILLAKAIMQNLGYQSLSTKEFAQLSLQQPTYFTMGNGQVGARPDIALMDHARALLCLCVENKQLRRDTSCHAWSHAQVVAHALGAYSVNVNEARAKAQKVRGLDPVVIDHLSKRDFDMVLPAFSLIGSNPCFYLIPITASFASAVARGQRPLYDTTVYYCEAPIEMEFLGMMRKDQCTIILQMFEAFKHFVPINFNQLCRFDQILNQSPLPRPLSPQFDSNVWTVIAAWFAKIESITTNYHPINYSGAGSVLTGTSSDNERRPDDDDDDIRVMDGMVLVPV